MAWGWHLGAPLDSHDIRGCLIFFFALQKSRKLRHQQISFITFLCLTLWFVWGYTWVPTILHIMILVCCSFSTNPSDFGWISKNLWWLHTTPTITRKRSSCQISQCQKKNPCSKFRITSCPHFSMSIVASQHLSQSTFEHHSSRDVAMAGFDPSKKGVQLKLPPKHNRKIQNLHWFSPNDFAAFVIVSHHTPKSHSWNPPMSFQARLPGIFWISGVTPFLECKK